MIQLENIEYLWFAVVVWIFWTIDYWRLLKKPHFAIPVKYQKSKKIYFRGVIFIIASVAWLSIGAGVSGPKEQLGKKESKRKINDVVFVLDISGSMRTVDFNPNRLEAAKSKIIEFIEMRPKDRIGVIIFGQKAFTLLPLTTDMKLIKKTISGIDFNYAGIGSGTNIGDALGLAIARCALSEAKNKTVILLTDGVSNSGTLTPIQSAREAVKAGIKINVIGIGTSGVKSIMPVVGKYGRKKKDRWGKVIMQKTPGGVDNDTMLEVSMLTGGDLYQANDENGLKNVFNSIDRLERAEIKSLDKYNYKEHYYILIFMGIVLLLLTEMARRIILKEGM